MSLPNCAEDCTSNLPVIQFNTCAPEINNGEIGFLYFTSDEDGNGLSDASNPLEWDSRMSQATAGADQIRALRVIGELPPVGDNEKEISGGRIINGVKDFLSQGDIDETNAVMHEALRAIECNTGSYRVWLETRDGLLFGGNDGIRNVSLKLKLSVPKSYNEIITMPWTAKWKNKFTPERQASVITDAMRNQ